MKMVVVRSRARGGNTGQPDPLWPDLFMAYQKQARLGWHVK